MSTPANAAMRQLQIDIITGEPNEILTWFNDFWNSLNVKDININNDQGIIYYDVDKNIIFYLDYNKGDNILWCHSFVFFRLSILSEYYDDIFDRININNIIKFLFTEIIKFDHDVASLTIIKDMHGVKLSSIKNHLKWKT